jgi:hypothetical protein
MIMSINFKEYDWRWSLPDFEVLCQHLSGGTCKPTKNLTVYSLSSGRKLKPILMNSKEHYSTMTFVRKLFKIWFHYTLMIRLYVYTECSNSHATHGEMQYNFFFILPISYNKCWKCPPLRSSQRWTQLIMLANTFFNVPVDILSTVRWMLSWSSCSVCGWFEYTVSLRCPHKKKSGGLKSGDRGGHNLFQMSSPGKTDSK